MFSNTQYNEHFMMGTCEWTGTSSTLSLPMFEPYSVPALTTAHQNIVVVHAYRVIDADAVDRALGSYVSGEHMVYVCLGCGRQFGDILNARLHIHHRHWRTPQPLECTGCHAKFSQKCSAQRHVDNREKRFGCSHCGRLYARSDYLIAHERNCAPTSAGPAL